MASSTTLEIFNPDVETIDDYKERFDFHCTAHDIPQRRRKALFLTRIGREAFVKLKTLVSPTSLDDLSLTDIITSMKQHYKKETVEIAERFKFFKRVQHDDEEVADYVAELRRLGKTCNQWRSQTFRHAWAMGGQAISYVTHVHMPIFI